jgi:maleylacetoacetate isomerase
MSGGGKLKLYHYWRSSCSWRVRWALNIKKLKCELVHVDLLKGEHKTPAHLERSALGFVPVLEFGGALKPVGSPYLTESMAILEWLEEIVPEPPLLPSLDDAEPLARARVRELCQIIVSGTQPAQNLAILDHFSNQDAARKEWARHFIRRGLTAFESIAKGTAGTFAYGDHVTMADLCLVPQVYNARRFDIDVDQEFPVLARVAAAAMETPECQAARP